MPTEAVPPDHPGLADRSEQWVGAYVHIPFCRRVCPYCDFAVIAGRDDLAAPYLGALEAEIAADEPFSRPLDAVFVGGGTPTSIDPGALGAVLESLAARFGFAKDAEVSIEANPEDLDSATMEEIVAAGFTRLSVGVQSFDPEVLASLGRRHTPAEAQAALERARSTFASVNADLIFGTVGESLDSWERSVRRALHTGVDHLSMYALTVERGTPLGRAVSRGAPGPDPDAQADAYLAAAAIAGNAGLVRYETSNFARPGHACRYNLLVWAQGEYAAFGNGAHRHRDGVRSWNVRRVDRYIERSPAASSGHEQLDPWRREVERAIVGLRRAAGVVPGAAGEALIQSVAGEQLIEAGVLEVSADRLTVLQPLLGDEVSRALLALDPPSSG